MSDYPVEERLQFIRDSARDIKIMLDQMMIHPAARTVENFSECKRILLLIDKTAEQHLRGLSP